MNFVFFVVHPTSLGVVFQRENGRCVLIFIMTYECFRGFDNGQSPILDQNQRRKSESVPKWSLFGALFAIFGPFFAKSDPVFAKIERNGAVFYNYENNTGVFALSRKIRTYSLKLTTNDTNDTNCTNF